MKSFILAALLAASSFVSASAESIILGTTQCGTLKQCVNVPNDAARDIDIYGAPGYPYFYVYIDGVQFKSMAPSTTDYAVPMTDASGNVVWVLTSFTSYRTCTRTGRGQTCLTHWALVSGQIDR